MRKLSIISALLWCGALYAVAGAIDERLSDKVTTHHIICLDDKTSVFDCKAPVYGETSFRADYRKQTVIENIDAATALNHCNVFDRENWRCDRDQVTTEEMIDGRYFMIIEGDHGPLHEIQIGPIRYFLYDIFQMLGVERGG
jgi:hypothetical protein